MKTKVLIFTDPHYKPSNRELITRVMQECEKYAEQHEIDQIYCLGDFYNDKSIIRSEVLRESYNFLKNSKFAWTILVGNHDLETTTSDNGHNALELFNELDNVKIIDKIEKVGDGHYMIPYYRNIDQLKSDISNIPAGSVLFMHQGIEGALYSSGVSQQSELKIRDLAAYEKIISGHIHKPQQIKNIYYIGSPVTHSIGEAGEDKRIIIYDFLDRSIEEIKLDYLPKHINIEFRADDFDVEDINKQLEANKDGYNRLVCIGNKEDIRKITKDLFIKVDNLSLNKIDVSSDKKILIDEKMSYNKMMEKYFNSVEVNLDKEKLLKLSNEILEKVQSAN